MKLHKCLGECVQKIISGKDVPVNMLAWQQAMEQQKRFSEFQVPTWNSENLSFVPPSAKQPSFHA